MTKPTRYIVTVAPHVIRALRRTWPVPASEHVVHALDERTARQEALLRVHIDADIPAIRSLTEQSWAYSRAMAESERLF